MLTKAIIARKERPTSRIDNLYFILVVFVICLTFAKLNIVQLPVMNRCAIVFVLFSGLFIQASAQTRPKVHQPAQAAPAQSAQAAPAQSSQASIQSIARPKLVVGNVVDQMGWDYLCRYSVLFQSGVFNRLLNEGFSCENTYIHHLPSYTAVGH